MNAAGHVSPDTRFLELPRFTLESGEALAPVRVAYRTWGELAPGCDNAVVVCHALTGSADVDAWWPELLGPGRALDPRRDFVVASNVLGSCYGTTGPASRRPDGVGATGAGGAVWGPDFPAITVRDMVRLQGELLAALGVERVKLVVGGSLGGMQVLEWGLLFPEWVEALAPIAVSGRHSAWCIAWSEAQRQAIAADPAWQGGRYDPERPPVAGLAAARMAAMVSYRSRASFEERFGRERQAGGAYAVEGYLRHQGEKLVDRFDANSYVVLTRAMDSHDLARGRGEYTRVLSGVERPTLVVSIDSDVLYPPEEQWELASWIPGAELARLSSPHGHDAFLIEVAALDARLRAFRARVEARVAQPRCAIAPNEAPPRRAVAGARL